MAKKNDTTNIKNLGKGILDTLTSINEEKSKDIENEKNNTVNTPKSTTALDEKSKRVSIEKSKSIHTQNNNTIKGEKDKSIKEEISKVVKEESSNLTYKEKNKNIKEKKNKRSFMLTEKSIQKLNMLNMALSNKDLSTIVDEAISIYFDENKYKIEELINKYNSLK